MKLNTKIVIFVVVASLLVAIICIVIGSLSDNQTDQNDYKINNTYVDKYTKASNNLLNDFVAIETASYPCKSTQASIYCSNTMKFVEDYALRRNIKLTKNNNNEYILRLTKTPESNIDKTTTIFINLEKYNGSNYGDGVIVDDDSKIVKGDHNYNLCVRSNLGIAIVFSLAQSNEFSHGPLDVVIGSKIPTCTNRIIELSASDKLNKVICSKSSNLDLIDNIYKDTLEMNVEKIENSSVPANYIGLGFDIDEVSTVNEVLHTDCLGAYLAILQRLLND